MQQKNSQPTRMRRRINDLVMAEMFLIQATLESATAIGDGVGDLSRQITGTDDSNESVQEALQRIKDQALEPYTSRYRFLKEMLSDDS